MLFLWIAVMVAVGWIVPRTVVRLMPGRWSVVAGTLAAWLVGFALVWAGAELTAALGGRDAKTELEANLNAWKLLLLLAPAAGLYHRRRLAAAEPSDRGEP